MSLTAPLRERLRRLANAHFEDGNKRHMSAIMRNETMSVKLEDMEKLLDLAEAAEKIEALLKDPTAVHVNMLRGSIATPSLRSMLHLHGEAAFARWERGKSPDDPPEW